MTKKIMVRSKVRGKEQERPDNERYIGRKTIAQWNSKLTFTVKKYIPYLNPMAQQPNECESI